MSYNLIVIAGISFVGGIVLAYSYGYYNGYEKASRQYIKALTTIQSKLNTAIKVVNLHRRRDHATDNEQDLGNA